MKILLSGAEICDGKTIERKDILITDGIVSDVSLSTAKTEDTVVFDCQGLTIFPGFTDVHVHLREPGFSYKETIETGTTAAAAGGYTAVCSMPNLKPVPSDAESLKVQLDLIEKNAKIKVIPYGSITVNQEGEMLSDMDKMADRVAGFSDDGRGVQNDEMMKSAMLKAKSLNKMIVAHCEVNDLLKGGYIHKGEYAKMHGHRGICSESEWKQIARDIELVKETGCSYHVCHISTKESVDIIRKAKADGVDITCETGPHYLILDDSCLQEDARFKMNPPLRDKSDKEALVAGMLDGTIDMIATDHAPHSAEEKGKGLEKSAMGVVGLETAFPEMYTNFVKKGILSLEKLVEIMHTNPNSRFGIDTGFEIGKKANLTVFDLNENYTVNPEDFKTMGRSTPFAGDLVYGKCLLTIADGNIAFCDERLREKL